MSMTDFVIVMILVMIVGLAVTYMVKAKKRGDKCIGCPSGGSCCSCSKSGQSLCNEKTGWRNTDRIDKEEHGQD